MGKGTLYVQPMMGQASQQPRTNVDQVTISASAEAYPSEPQEARHPAPNNNYDEPYYPERIPLGVFLADKIINGTTGTLSVDLKRPQMASAQGGSLFRQRRAPPPPPPATGWGGAWGNQGYPPPPPPPQTRRSGRRPRSAAHPSAPAVDADAPLLPNVSFNPAGARVKAMRHASWGPKIQIIKYGMTRTQPLMDLGVGLEFELDTAVLRPLARLKVADIASFKIFPEPTLKISKRLQLGTSGFAVRLAYECPFEGLGRFYSPPAKFLVSLDNAVDTGMRLTQSGVEFAANRWLLDGNVRLRAAGVLELPSELPVAEDESLVRFDMRRLGMKARW